MIPGRFDPAPYAEGQVKGGSIKNVESLKILPIYGNIRLAATIGRSRPPGRLHMEAGGYEAMNAWS
jgi:hypothetical protein